MFLKKIKTCIIGASGYTGAELVRILKNHEHVEIVALAAEKNAGNNMADIYSHLSAYDLPTISKLSDINLDKIDLVFCCLPHATSQEVIKNLPNHIKVIDLSADFRLFDIDLYEKWYGHKHQAPELQKQAVYGLCEINRSKIKNSRIIANPGCYPTCSSLPLIPLLADNAIIADDIIIDAKSGVSGAGRSEKLGNLFCEVNESVKPYSVCKHRHMPEIEQSLSEAAGEAVSITFTPQLLPVNRGIISTIYVKHQAGFSTKSLWQIINDRYRDENFVHVLEYGKLPALRDVFATNNCVIGITPGKNEKSSVIVSVIDNLCKGASGQAVQNMNIMYGIKETTGLSNLPVFP